MCVPASSELLSEPNGRAPPPPTHHPGWGLVGGGVRTLLVATEKGLIHGHVGDLWLECDLTYSHLFCKTDRILLS